LRRLIIAESEADLTSYAGLGLIGMALNQQTNLVADTAAVSPLRADAIPHADILSSYLALLCLGKSDFEAITPFREDAYFAEALNLVGVPLRRDAAPGHGCPCRGVSESGRDGRNRHAAPHPG
jgi:hypothetical protein